jgi:hypothetical protein
MQLSGSTTCLQPQQHYMKSAAHFSANFALSHHVRLPLPTQTKALTATLCSTVSKANVKNSRTVLSPFIKHARMRHINKYSSNVAAEECKTRMLPYQLFSINFLLR